MARVIMASIPLLGHTNPLLPISRGLVEQGHDVTYLTGSVLRKAVESTGAKFRSLRGAADFDGTKMLEEFASLKLAAPGVDQITRYVDDVFIPPIATQYAVIQEVLSEGDPDTTVVLHDVFFHGLWPIALGAGGLRPAGVVGLGVTVLGLSSDDVAPFGSGLAPDRSAGGRARNRMLNDEVQRDFAPVQQRLDALLAELGAVRPAPYYWDAHALLPDLTFQLSIPGLEYPRTDLPAHIQFAGRLDESGDAGELPLWWPDVLDAERVIFVSQGSLNNDNFKELAGPTLDALADYDALVVVTMGGRPVPGGMSIPTNARVASYVPYQAILPHTDVFVSNGGFGGVQTALSFGVPMVLAGETEEKKDSTTHVEWAGAGVNLRTGRPSRDAIRAAVHTVIHNASFLDNAARLKKEYCEYDTLKIISEAIRCLLADPRSSAGHSVSGATPGSGVLRAIRR